MRGIMPQNGAEHIELLLVGEDEKEIELLDRELAARYPGIAIRTAANGSDGVARFREGRPDLVLADLTTPDGIQASEAIRELDSDAAIVALVAHSDTHALIRGVEVGIASYLFKPVVFDMLFAILDRSFENIRLKRELARKNEHLRKLSWAVEHSPVSVVITDRAGTIEYVNRRFTELTGYSVEEAIGQNVNLQQSGETPQEVYRELWRTIHAGQVWQGHFLNRKKNGTRYWEHASIAPIPDDSGAVTHFVAVKEDFTQMRRMVKALQRSQKKFAAVFQAAPALILICSEKGKVIGANETFLKTTRFPRAEVLGRMLCDLALWADEKERDKVRQGMRQEGPLDNLEIVFLGRDGKRHVGLLSTARVALEERSYHLSLIRDITERKEKEAEIEVLNARLAARATELEMANRELEAFNSMIAHDLRNPLNVINSYCQMIKEFCGERLDSVGREYLQEIYRGTLSMNRLIDALLDFSRLAHLEPARREVDLSECARRVVRQLRQTHPECRVQVQIASGVRGKADPELVRLVLHNLLGNAVKYNCGNEAVLVEFGATIDEGRPLYFVRDNGIGFDPADAGKLFIPFQRLPGAEEVRGHGVGLASVARIIERHGGRVWAEGAVGKGAAFFFTLE